MQKIINAILLIAISTLIFLHNPFSGYGTTITHQHNEKRYKALATENSTDKECRDFNSSHTNLSYAALLTEQNIAKTYEELLNTTDQEHITQLNNKISIKQDEVVRLKEDAESARIQFYNKCQEEIISVETIEPIPFIEWNSQKPVLVYFKSLAKTIYWIGFFLVIYIIIYTSSTRKK